MDVVTQGKTKAGTYRSKDLDLSRFLSQVFINIKL
jgi:hypothetical protein